jgi:serine/threonine-protein kinase
LIGKTISHYRIIGKLGEGGMGVVYRAEDTSLDREVALKFLSPRVVGGDDDRARFVREAKSAASINHPNICTVHAIDEFKGDVFIAMEFVDGQDLRRKLRDGPLEVDDALAIASQVADGLACAHGRGIVHRDIKPANIMVTPTGLVKIMDFGLARGPAAAQLTMTGTTIGTAAYMSPEQARGDEVGPCSDLWSLGVVLYEMVTGERPFRGEHEQAVIYAILNSEPAGLASPLRSLPSKVAAVISRSLQKDPRNRYRRAEEMSSAMMASCRGGGTPTAAIATARVDDLPSIAILPFENLSPDPENVFFGDGLAEELATALSRLPKLRVAARTSAFKLRGKDLDAREIGTKLGVGAILEGSVRKAGSRLRVTAKLVDTSDGFQLWSERYDRDMEDIFAVQDDITAAIVEQLSVRLEAGQTEPAPHRPTDNLDAYALYLKGLHHWNSLTPEGLRKSRECYEGAVEIDPNYALAHAALSMWHQSLAFWADAVPAEAFAKSRGEALRALEIDDSVALAHNCLGIILCMHDWRWSEAEAEFKRALECDASSPFGHLNYSFHLSSLGRHEEAVEEARIAMRLDPLSTVINTWAASRLLPAGRVDEGLAILEDVTARDPNAWQPHLWLSEALLYAGLRDRAVAHAERAAELAGHLAVTKAILASACYLVGRGADGDTVLRELEDRASKGYISPVLLARVHISRGTVGDAVNYAERGFAQHDHWLQGVPSFAPQLRFNDPRLAAILERIGLPVASPASAAGSGPQGMAPATDPDRHDASIAVMAFADMSAERDQEYFCDGVAEEIINELTGIEGLRVIARTSAFSFKGKNEDIREIGGKLSVSSILEGSVRKAGDRVRITAQLIDVADGSHIWSEKYDRVLEDVFAVQDEIAAAIADKLRVELGEQGAATGPRKVNPEAHDLFLRGRHLMRRGLFTILEDQTRVDRALELFERAAEVDPTYAAPHAGLAEVYGALCKWVKPDGNCEKAKQEAVLALALDDESVEAHVAMGRVALAVDLDWGTAEAEVVRALELGPGSAVAHKGATMFYTWAANFDRALELADTLVDLDPLDYDTHLIATFAMVVSRKSYARCIELSETALELFPGDKYFESIRLWSKVVLGIDTEETARAYAKKWPNDAGSGVLCAMAGLNDEAHQLIELQAGKEHGGTRYAMARIYAALGEKDRALDLLEQTWEEEPRIFLQLNSDPELDCLRGEQRFKDLVKRSGVPMGDLAYLSE